MGTAKAAVALVAACGILLGAVGTAGADPCRARSASGSYYPICFDIGNRLYLEGGTRGVGVGIAVRHLIDFEDEPDLSWKLSHAALDGTVGGLDTIIAGTLYRGRYLRHARDGHLVLPLGTPRKIFLPFDIGAETELGRVLQRRTSEELEIGVLRIAGLIDFSRTPSFRRRYTIGLVALWNLHAGSDLLREGDLSIQENRVAPLSLLSAAVHLESANGLQRADLGIQGGRIWSDLGGWESQASATASVERVLLALNDRPLSLVAEGRTRWTRKSGGEIVGIVAARFSLFSLRGASAL